MITFTFTDQNGVETSISTKGNEWGSTDTGSRRQVVGETMGDQIFVYSLAKKRRELNLSFTQLNDSERADIERFFGEDLVDYAKRWFLVSVPPTRRVILRSGAAIGGATIKAGSTYKAGQFAIIDEILFYVRLISPQLEWTEENDGYYSLTMVLRILEGARPDNQ